MNGLIDSGRIIPLAFSFLMLAAAQARVITVDDDGVADYRSIGAAVEAAESGDTIVVGTGMHMGGSNRDVAIIGKMLTIRSTDPNDPAVVAATTINCQGSEADPRRAFDIGPDPNSGLTLEGLTITNGYSPTTGGALLCEDATLNIRNCTFTRNATSWWGGALYCADSQVSLEGCTFAGNTSTTLHAGAISFETSLVDMARCSFEKNTGSAIYSHNSGLMLTECAFQQNTGRDGGAILSRLDSQTSAAAHLNLAQCTFIANAVEGAGGALYNHGIEAMLEACRFAGNRADGDGGAVYNYGSSPDLHNCAFIGNTAEGLGGAVMNWYASHPSVIHCTFVANRATAGGAIATVRDSSVLVSHSILWNNTADRGNSLYVGRFEWGAVQPAQATVEFCDVAGGQADVALEPDCTLNWKSGNIDRDPLFTGPKQDDYRLSPDSPCIDAGDPAYIPEPGATDLDNTARLFGPATDLGAYEFQGLGPVYRFWSAALGKHFYTIRGKERDKLITEFPHVWEFEDVAYYAFYAPVTEELLPVHRFWSPRLRSHFWTISEAERRKVVDEFGKDWTYEGVVFYAYPQRRQPLGTMPVYRFWSHKYGHHFYTMNEKEKNKLIESYQGTWDYEGVAWYAYARPVQPGLAGYLFTGGRDEALYTLALKAYIDGREAEIDAPVLEFVPAATQMRMEVDFDKLTVQVDEVRIQTERLLHSGTIRAPGTKLPAIPFSVTAQASFAAMTRRGPFDVDPQSRVFADFTAARQSLSGQDERFTYQGSVILAGQPVNFQRTTDALQFELEAAGVFESLGLLPDALYARMPFTFQWHRQYAKDLLAETSIDGRLVQLYVVYAYVSTQGLWKGDRIE